MEKYIHPGDDRIKNFISELYLQEKTLEEVVCTVFDWFDAHIDYSRLNNPFYPLQRSDLDVLGMLSGTCGDYSNYLVYTEKNAVSPIMCRISGEHMYFSFSEREAKHIWDIEQWSQEYLEESVPEKYKTRYYENVLTSIQNNLPRIKAIIEDI